MSSHATDFAVSAESSSSYLKTAGAGADVAGADVGCPDQAVSRQVT